MTAASHIAAFDSRQRSIRTAPRPAGGAGRRVVRSATRWRWRSLHCSSRHTRRSACSSGRGEGSIADDVYALLGCCCCAWCSAARHWHRSMKPAIIRRKPGDGDLCGTGRRGTFAAHHRRSGVRGMLAEDPEHRPTPTLLCWTSCERTRSQGCLARPPRRAMRRDGALASGEIWDARSLAHAMAVIEPEQGLHALRSGNLSSSGCGVGLGGSGALAARMEELVRHRNLDGMPEDPSSGGGYGAMRATHPVGSAGTPCAGGGLRSGPMVSVQCWPSQRWAPIADVMMRLEEVLLHEEMVGLSPRCGPTVVTSQCWRVEAR